MYGKQSQEVVRGVLIGIYFACDAQQGQDFYGGNETIRDWLREAINDLAECPEDFDVEAILKRGYV